MAVLDELDMGQPIQKIPMLSSLRRTEALDVEGVQVPPSTNIHLFVQEALINIMKHALAAKASVSLYSDNQIALKIIDNGQGLYESRQYKSSGIDICEYIGAKLSVLSDEGVSLRVLCLWVDWWLAYNIASVGCFLIYSNAS